MKKYKTPLLLFVIGMTLPHIILYYVTWGDMNAETWGLGRFLSVILTMLLLLLYDIERKAKP